MIVTKVESLSSSRMKIVLDNEFAFVLYKGELRLYGIREGKELSQNVWEDISENVLKKRARLRCMNLLKERDYTEYQLMQKLLSGGYSHQFAEDALNYVKSYGYVDDSRYAFSYIENQMEKKSRRRMEEELLRKGISREKIRAAFEQLEDCGEEVDELALAKQLLAKKHYDSSSADYKERQKMAAYLYRKGIGLDTIHIAICLQNDGNQV